MYIWKENIKNSLRSNTRWRTLASRWDGEICNLYEVLNIGDDIKIRRLGWAGHIVRMEDETIPPKKFLMGNFII